MVGLVVQLWDQNPVIFAMVVGLVLFGTYAALVPHLDDDGLRAGQQTNSG
jgi:hypothetical protein